MTNHSPAPLARAGTLAEAVAAAVRDMVRAGELEAGGLYSVQQVADRLGVSRSPAREALLGLAEAGAVVFERNRGFRVVLPQARDIAEIFAVRLALEPTAAARAAASADQAVRDDLVATVRRMRSVAAAGDAAAYWEADRELHRKILLAGGNRRAARVVDDLRSATHLLGPRTTDGARPSADGSGPPDGGRSLPEIAREHEPLVAAVTAGDAEAARRAMHDHLVTTGRLLLRRAARTPAEADAVWDELVHP